MGSAEQHEFGEAVRWLRETVDLTRAALAKRALLSESHLRNIENGHRSVTNTAAKVLDTALGADGTLIDLAMAKGDHVRRRSLLRAVAAIANVQMVELTGITTALSMYPAFGGVSEPARPVSEIRQIASRVHRCYQAAEYTKATRLLPNLITDVDALAALRPSREVFATQASIYVAAAKLATKLRNGRLAWATADRAATAALHAGELTLSAAAAYQVVCAELRVSRSANAERIAVSSSEVLTESTPLGLSLQGALILISAVAAGRRGDRAEAFDRLSHAKSIADRLGRDRNEGWTAFGPTNVRIHQISTAVEIGDVATAIAGVEQLDTSGLPSGLRSRRAQVHIDGAWAYAQRRKDSEAIKHLLSAEQHAPQAMRASDVAASIQRELLKRERVSATPQLRPLARRSGLIP